MMMMTNVCVVCTERNLVVNLFCYSFICLRCVGPVPIGPVPIGPVPIGPVPIGPVPIGPVPVQYTLSLITVRMKVLQNRRLVT